MARDESSSSPTLRLLGVGKRYDTTDGERVALQDISFDVRQGEFISVIGPSGCGKTTLLRLLAGLEAADAGRIWIGDREVGNLEPAARDVAMVFQNYALYPHFTVFENIAFPLRARGVSTSEIEGRVRAAAARVALEALLERHPAQLSGGQQQRVALARAIVRNPAVYLMDEPLSNLDAQLRLQTRTELKRLHQELGTTIVYVTHDQAEAMTLGTRIAIMQQGSIVQVGAPLDLYRSPDNTFVAQFLGSPPINLLPIDGLGAQGSSVRALPGSTQAGIRPEDVQVSVSRGVGSIEGVARVLEPMGSESLLTVELGATRVVARVAPDVRVEPGQQVWIRLPADRILHFDGEGRRIHDPVGIPSEAS